MNKVLFYLLILISLLQFSCVETRMELFVSPEGNDQNDGSIEAPFQTIETALIKAEEMKSNTSTRPISIHLEAGTYRLAQPIRLNETLSGLKIIGKGVEKTILKGSKTIALQWEKFTDDIWIAKLEKKEQFDQLIANGTTQILARYPNYDENGGHWQGHATDVISPERVMTWANPIGGFVHAMHSGEWGGFHYRISAVNEDYSLQLEGGHQNNRPSPMHAKYRMIENIFEELDSPKEWFYDENQGYLYYWPDKNSDPNKLVFELVNQKHLIEILGTEENPVKDITIEGIRFEHAQRTFMETFEPLLRSDWTIYRGAAVFIEGAESSQITDCEFRNLGGNVIFVSKYARSIRISGNHIHDVGGSGISFVGDPNAVRSPSFQYGEFVPLDEMDTLKGPATNNYPSESIVDNNLIYRTGRLEKQTAGVQISMAMNITVSNNSIYEVPRAGINVSEGTWGGHLIEYNDVFSTVLETSDHGAFNSWGRDRFWHPNRNTLNEITSNNPDMPYWDAVETTVIRNNRFRCDHGWDIDLDDGSSNYLIYNNLCLKGGIKLREGFYRTVENNIMVNNSLHPHVWFKNSGDVFRKNIVMLAYKDIRLQGWGKEFDLNLFPNEAALKKAQQNGTDPLSSFGNPLFRAPEKGDYSVAENSPALTLGFTNFEMDQFGVKKPALKEIARTPELPQLWSLESKENKIIAFKWLGAEIKNIESIEEQSASGLTKLAGVFIKRIEENGILASSALQEGDVIVKAEGEEIATLTDLMKVFEGNNWKGRLEIVVIRDQKEQKMTVLTKK